MGGRAVVVDMTPVLSALEPLRVVDGGRLWLRGRGLAVPVSSVDLCTVDGRPVRTTFAAADRRAVEIPPGLPGGQVEVKATDVPGTTLFAEVGLPIATGLHQVDSPVVDREGRAYGTYSGSRGQEAPVSVFRIPPGGAREALVTGIVNATSMAFDPSGVLHVSSRFDGSVHRVFEDGRHELVASDLGQACGLAFAGDGSLLVGDRSGTLFHVERGGRTRTLASLPASVAAFHLAMSPDGDLCVTGPTLSTLDRVYRVGFDGRVDTIDQSFGRPQGLAFDAAGALYVTEALAGASGIYRLHDGRKTLVVSGPRLVGLAFGPSGEMVVATSDTLYRFKT